MSKKSSEELISSSQIAKLFVKKLFLNKKYISASANTINTVKLFIKKIWKLFKLILLLK